MLKQSKFSGSPLLTTHSSQQNIHFLKPPSPLIIKQRHNSQHTLVSLESTPPLQQIPSLAQHPYQQFPSPNTQESPESSSPPSIISTTKKSIFSSEKQKAAPRSFIRHSDIINWVSGNSTLSYEDIMKSSASYKRSTQELEQLPPPQQPVKLPQIRATVSTSVHVSSTSSQINIASSIPKEEEPPKNIFSTHQRAQSYTQTQAQMQLRREFSIINKQPKCSNQENLAKDSPPLLFNKNLKGEEIQEQPMQHSNFFNQSGGRTSWNSSRANDENQGESKQVNSIRRSRLKLSLLRSSNNNNNNSEADDSFATAAAAASTVGVGTAATPLKQSQEQPQSEQILNSISLSNNIRPKTPFGQLSSQNEKQSGLFFPASFFTSGQLQQPQIKQSLSAIKSNKYTTHLSDLNSQPALLPIISTSGIISQNTQITSVPLTSSKIPLIPLDQIATSTAGNSNNNKINVKDSNQIQNIYNDFMKHNNSRQNSIEPSTGSSFSSSYNQQPLPVSIFSAPLIGTGNTGSTKVNLANQLDNRLKKSSTIELSINDSLSPKKSQRSLGGTNNQESMYKSILKTSTFSQTPRAATFSRQLSFSPNDFSHYQKEELQNHSQQSTRSPSTKRVQFAINSN